MLARSCGGYINKDHVGEREGSLLRGVAENGVVPLELVQRFPEHFPRLRKQLLWEVITLPILNSAQCSYVDTPVEGAGTSQIRTSQLLFRLFIVR